MNGKKEYALVDSVTDGVLQPVTSNAVFDKFNSRVERFAHGRFEMWSDGYDYRLNFNPLFPDEDHLIISVIQEGIDNASTEVTYWVNNISKDGFTVHTNGPSGIHQQFYWFAHYSN